MPIKWLMENAEAVVRYRTQIELMEINKKEQLQENLTAVLALPQTLKRMDMLRNMNYSRVHGSDSTHLENILPMLNDFGLHYGVDAVRLIIRDNLDIKKVVTGLVGTFGSCSPMQPGYSYYDKIIAYPFLLRSRIPINGLLDFAIDRINTIYDFTRHRDFNIYDDAANYKGIPKPFTDRPIVKPEIAYSDMCRLPMIYDIVTLAEVYHRVPSEIQEK